MWMSWNQYGYNSRPAPNSTAPDWTDHHAFTAVSFSGIRGPDWNGKNRIDPSDIAVSLAAAEEWEMYSEDWAAACRISPIAAGWGFADMFPLTFEPQNRWDVPDRYSVNRQWDEYRKDFDYAATIRFQESCDALILMMDRISRQTDLWNRGFMTHHLRLPCGQTCCQKGAYGHYDPHQRRDRLNLSRLSMSLADGIMLPVRCSWRRC